YGFSKADRTGQRRTQCGCGCAFWPDCCSSTLRRSAMPSRGSRAGVATQRWTPTSSIPLSISISTTSTSISTTSTSISTTSTSISTTSTSISTTSTSISTTSTSISTTSTSISTTSTSISTTSTSISTTSTSIRISIYLPNSTSSYAPPSAAEPPSLPAWRLAPVRHPYCKAFDTAGRLRGLRVSDSRIFGAVLKQGTGSVNKAGLAVHDLAGSKSV
ncbi:hypothetical protein GQ44DRAFT_784669, partial [Phaeosphaeriaceae sp. PMI808]